MRALLVLAALLLAGCSAPTPEAPDGAAAATEVALAGDAPSFELFTPDPVPALALAAVVEPRWVRPGEAMDASVDAPPGASVDWVLASRNPIRTDLPPPLAARAQPGGSVGVTLRDPGRHVFDVGGARLVVAIAPDAPPAGLLVVASQGAAGWSVVPQLLRGGPGSTLRVEDRGAADLLVQRVDLETHVASGRNASFSMPPGLEMGDYDVVAHVVGPDGAGEPSARIIYDRRKPDEAWAAGPYTGGFQVAANAQPQRYELRMLVESVDVRVDLATTSAAPIPHGVVVKLLDGAGDELASGSAPGFDVARIPKGTVWLVVTPTDGALIEYSLSAGGRYVLDAPASFFDR